VTTVPSGATSTLIVACGTGASAGGAVVEATCRTQRTPAIGWLPTPVLGSSHAIGIHDRVPIAPLPKRQRAAADRFADFTTFHSEYEITMCTANPPDLNARDACWIRYDYECLARLARVAALAMKQ